MQQNYHHALPRTFAPNRGDRLEQHSVDKRITYINRTHREIVVCERSNLKLVLPPRPVFQKEQEVIIRVEYWIHDEKVKNNSELLLDRLRNVGDHLKIFYNAFGCNPTAEGGVFRGLNFAVEYAIDLHTLEDYGGAVYYKEIDTVIAVSGQDECPDHPFSYESESAIGGAESSQPTYGINVDLYVNDPFNRYGERYVNLFGQVYCVRTVQLFDRREGIYLCKTINGKSYNVYTAFDQTEKEINLYRVEDEALTDGHVDILLKKNLAELEQNNLILKRELENSKLQAQRQQQDYDARKIELDREREEWRIRKDREDLERKAEYERMRDFYEYRSYQRKDTNEMLKYIPTLVVGLGAVFVAVKSVLKDKDK